MMLDIARFASAQGAVGERREGLEIRTAAAAIGRARCHRSLQQPCDGIIVMS
jgi:hypothetical protein